MTSIHPNTSESPISAVQEVPIDQRAAQVAYRVFNAERRDWPFPHAIFDTVLPDDLFRALRSIPLENAVAPAPEAASGKAASEIHRHSVSVSLETVDTDPDLDPLFRYTYRVLSHPLSVRALSRFFGRDLVAAFGRTDLPLSSTMLMVEDRTGYALLPHTDVPHKAVTLLLYLAEEGADPSLGTELYVPAPGVSLTGSYPMRGRFQRSPFLRVATAPYRPNAGLMFAPSTKSFHGVKEVVGDNRTRRLLQFQLLVNDPAIRRVDDDRAPSGQGAPTTP